MTDTTRAGEIDDSDVSQLIYDWNSKRYRGPVIANRAFELHDETLRDGIQNPSVVDPEIEDKLEILHMLEEIGVDTIDVGLPGAGQRAFNDVLRDIFMAVATYGGIDQTRSTLEAWIAGSGYGPIFGEQVEEDGSISVLRTVQAMGEVDIENPMEALHQALHELSAFALFAATTTLPRDQELALSRDVNTRLKRIRI